MGLFNGIMKIGEGAGKLAIGTAYGTGKIATGITGIIGNSVMKELNKNTLAVAGSALTGAAIGGILADSDGNVNPTTGMLKGGTLGLGLSMIPGAASIGAGLGVATIGAASMGLGAAGQVGKSMVKVPPKNIKVGLDNINEFKLSKLAPALLIGAAAVKGLGDSVKAFEQSRMGENDGMFRSATPMIPMQQATRNRPYSFENNAGATGDLVFALNANR